MVWFGWFLKSHPNQTKPNQCGLDWFGLCGLSRDKKNITLTIILPTFYKINIGHFICCLHDKILGKTYIKIGKIKKKHKHESNYWEEKETNSSLEMNWIR